MIVAFALYATVSLTTTRRRWNEAIERYATSASEMVRHATHQAMLVNRKEDIRGIMESVASSPYVVGARVIDKQGRIIASSHPVEEGTVVDMQAEACVICHSGNAGPSFAGGRVRVYEMPGRGTVLGLVHPIRNDPECSGAACHAHDRGKTILGVLDVQMSTAFAEASLRAATREILLLALVMVLLVSGLIAAFLVRVVRNPVHRLIAGTERVAHGDLDTLIDVRSRDEIGQLGAAFNRMILDVRQARAEITRWSETLEQKVVDKTEELGRAQRQIVHMEKMASLGKLSATVAHELNNPLAGILNYSRLAERTLREGEVAAPVQDEVRRYLLFVQKEAGRCGEIVRNLLLFAKPSGANFAPHGLNSVLERCLMLVRHHLEIAGVRLEHRPAPGDDRLVCDGNQLQQAVLALLVNAVEAMPEGGTLTLAAGAAGDTMTIEVADTGVGIPPDAIPHIFEPFFTTKEAGSGVGLGLSVVYGIVQRHRGRIEVDSQPGRGTAFRIEIPRSPDAAPVQEREPAKAAPRA